MAATVCTFRGVPLPIQTPETQLLVDDLYRPEDVFGPQPEHYGGTTIPLPTYPTLPDLTVGVLKWPYRVSAFASFCAVVPAATWNAIATGSGDVAYTLPVPAPVAVPAPPPPTPPPTIPPASPESSLTGALILSQGTDSISIPMYALRPKRITNRTDSPVLLTLVDRRYWVANRAVEITQAANGTVTVNRGSTTSTNAWSNLAGALAPESGFSIAALTGTTTVWEHGTPNNQWSGNGVPTQLALETVAHSLGRRVWAPAFPTGGGAIGLSVASTADVSIVDVTPTVISPPGESVVSFSWTASSSGSPQVFTPAPVTNGSFDLADGTHTLTLTVTFSDDTQAEGSITVTLPIASNPLPSPTTPSGTAASEAGTEFKFSTFSSARSRFNTHFTATETRRLITVGGRFLNSAQWGAPEQRKVYHGDGYASTYDAGSGSLKNLEALYLPAKGHTYGQALADLRYKWSLWRRYSVESQNVISTPTDLTTPVKGLVRGDPGPIVGGIEWGIVDGNAYTTYRPWVWDVPRIRSGGGSGGTTGPASFMLSAVPTGLVCDLAGQLKLTFATSIVITGGDGSPNIVVSGTVTNSGGSPVSGVTISGSTQALNSDRSMSTIATTGGDGKYSGTIRPYVALDGSDVLRIYAEVSAGAGYTPNPSKFIVATNTNQTVNFVGV